MTKAAGQAGSARGPWPGGAQAWGTTGLLMAAYFMSYVDRSILSLVVEPVKSSLSLSDTQIGLLQGPAFGVFFMLMTFPAGWIADRGHRTRLIAAGIIVWSVMTAVSGLCVNYAQLLLARMGVAVGEATLTPTGPSVIADNFPPEQRTLPLSLYGLGALCGAGCALIGGGLVASLVSGPGKVAIFGFGAFEPWQIIFFVVSLPGVLLGIGFLFVPEPQRRNTAQAQGTFAELLQVVSAHRAVIIPHFAGVCLFQIYASAFLAWLPAFFMRVHGWSLADVGLKYGVVHLTFGILGAAGGGLLARALWRTGRADANLLTGALCFAGMSVPAVLATVAPSATVAAVLLGLTMGLAQGPGGANVAAIQEIIPNRLRGRVTAIFYATMAISGITLGPLLIGVMNDHLFSNPADVGKSMSLTALATLPLSAVLLFVAARARLRMDPAI